MKNRECKTQTDKKSIISVNIIKTRKDMTDEEFNSFMEISLKKAKKDESVSVDEAFEELFKEMG